MLVYTVWLKRRTPQNIVIGGAAGAARLFERRLQEIHRKRQHVDLGCRFLGCFSSSSFSGRLPIFGRLRSRRSGEYGKVNIPMLNEVKADHLAPVKGVLRSAADVGFSSLFWPESGVPLLWAFVSGD